MIQGASIVGHTTQLRKCGNEINEIIMAIAARGSRQLPHAALPHAYDRMEHTPFAMAGLFYVRRTSARYASRKLLLPTLFCPALFSLDHVSIVDTGEGQSRMQADARLCALAGPAQPPGALSGQRGP